MFKNARWIGEHRNTETIETAPLFRKTFEVKKSVLSATMYACGLGHALYTINGKNITDEVMITPISKYDTRVYYSTFDVTEFLCEGKNAIGCILGNGWYFVTIPRWDYFKPNWLSYPKLIMRLVIEYVDGTTEEILSDTSWKTEKSAITYNEDKCGEFCDARLYKDNWDMPEFDDSDWKNAFICNGPGGLLEPITFPVIRITNRFQGKKISDNVYDIGQNISGWVRIKVKGKRGSEVTIRYAERLYEDGRINPDCLLTIPGSYVHTDKYILRGDDLEEWAPNFAYHGFRYAEITGDAEILEVTGEVIHTDLTIHGSFKCSDEMINKIHRASCWATLTNIQGIITDCTQREQNGWSGDAVISAEQSLMNYDMVSIHKKCLVDFCDTQRPNGQTSCIAPTGGWGYNWGIGPTGDSAIVLIPYYIYQYTGDKSALIKFWDNMVRYMEFMETMTENDMLSYGLGDWCVPTGKKACPVEITDTACFYLDYKTMARCAEILGKDASFYNKRADEIKASFRKKYIENDFYLGNHPVAISCVIFNGLYTDEERPIAAKRLNEIYSSNGYHMECGVPGIKYIFTALAEYGYSQTLYKLVTNPEMPSYAHWINSGMTTLCEQWEMKDSLNHHFFSEVDMWFYKYLAGIRINEGYESVEIQPAFVPEIEWVDAKHKGISVYYDKDKVEITSDIPVTYISENGEKIHLGTGTYTLSR